MTLDRLSAEDARILSLESGRIAGHTVKVLVLDPPAPGGEPLTVQRLRAHVSARLDAAPRLRRRVLATPLGLAPPVWVDDPGFDIADHVRAVAAPPHVGPAELRAIVAGLMTVRLPRGLPLWSLDVVTGLDAGRTGLVWKVHHALADGMAAMRIGEAVLWAPSTAPRDQRWNPAPLPGAADLVADAALKRLRDAAGGLLGAARAAPDPGRWKAVVTQVAQLPAMAARELLPDPGPPPLDRPISARRAVAFASAPLRDLRHIEHAHPGATINDVVLACVAGALRLWLERHHGPTGDLQVKVPVSMHGRDAHTNALANRDSWLCVHLPLHEADPLRRLALIVAETAQRKRAHDADTLDAVRRELSAVSPRLERLAERLAAGPRQFALNVSNVPGPREPIAVLGCNVRSMHSLAEVAGHHALRVAAISLAQSMAFGLCADAEAFSDVESLAEGIEHTAGAMLAAVDARSGA